MQSRDESFARVREARGLDELVADDAWGAETVPGASGEAGPQAVVHFCTFLVIQLS